MKKQRKKLRIRKPRFESFQIPLDDGFVVMVEFWSALGRITRFAAVLIRLVGNKEDSVEICRYDNAHGFAHLDVLDKKRRLVEKIPILGTPSPNTALEYAIDDFKANFRTYWKKLQTRKDSPRK